MSRKPTTNSQRTPRRRASIICFLLGLLLGGVLAYRWLHPGLHLVAEYTLPKDATLHFRYGFGYPAVVSRITNEEDGEAVWLDALCRPGKRVKTMECTANSPGYAVYADEMYVSAGRSKIVMHWQDGRTTEINPSPLWRDENALANLASIADNGVVMDNQGIVFDRHGKPLNVSKDGRRYQLASSICLDPETVPLYSFPDQGIAYVDRARFGKFHLYDLRTGRIVFTHNTMFSPTAILREGERYLLLPADKPPLVIERGLAIKTGIPIMRWMWGDDGSVWTCDDSISFLHWHQGTVRLESHALPAVDFPPPSHALTVSGQVGKDSDGDPELHLPPAVWDDGALVAYVEQRPMLPRPVWPLLKRMQETPRNAWLHRAALRLTVMRQGKILGRHTILLPIDRPTRIPRGVIFPDYKDVNQHLAFSRDGRYLSWTLNKGDGWKVYVFEVQKRGRRP